MDDIYLTQYGYEKLVNELNFLKKEKRKQLSKAMSEEGRSPRCQAIGS